MERTCRPHRILIACRPDPGSSRLRLLWSWRR